MTRATSTGSVRRLPPRDPKGGRPTQEVAARLGVHILDVALEQFIAHVHPGREAEFEAVMERALRPVMSRAEGLLGWRFRRCAETPGRYQVQIHWDSLESHMVKSRQGPIAP